MTLNASDLKELQADLEERRTMLLNQRQTLAERRQELHAEQAEPEEMARNEDERRALSSMQDRMDDELVLVDEALQRIANGSYGRCLDCGEEISLDRLHAKPWAQYCRRHVEAHEGEPGTEAEEGEGVTLPDEFVGLDDAAIALRVVDALNYDGRVSMDSLDVEFTDGRLRLSGMLPGHDAHEALRNVVREELGFEDYVDDTHVERPLNPPRRTNRTTQEHETEEEELFQGEEIETDPNAADEEGEVLDPSDTFHSEE
ncbi:TraR/DksA C4-type zinc finger protein [Oceanidesulfovibrio marinus]|uniref:BON domain-containing protein n=1 Tax=Oceanidesulfovibrio marinus TaxID=370038 RepID=A0A6P1ZGU4_9BACT|nr:TraR/DksA C4-type zinc finger protein [Oceanidesulfovibrio marinus]TVM33639.1 hypothetical protein DQK91_10435 [Oceanidesulfovibrio marinus]